MIEIGIAQAKSHFSKLTAQVDAGEQVILTKRGRPTYQLIRLPSKKDAHVAGRTNIGQTAKTVNISGAPQLRERLANLASLSANDPVYPGSFVADMRKLDLL